MRKPLRRAILGLAIAIGPLFTACQAVLDFDRTPLQPIYEAGPPPEDSGPDAPADAPPRETGSEAGGDAGEAGPSDSGSDAMDAADG